MAHQRVSAPLGLLGGALQQSADHKAQPREWRIRTPPAEARGAAVCRVGRGQRTHESGMVIRVISEVRPSCGR